MGGGRGGVHGGHDVWGNMAHFRGVVTHHISPFEQRAFAGWMKNGFPNTIRRIRGQIFKIGTPMFLGLMIYTWANQYHEKLIRKDPKHFENEYSEYLMSDEHKAYLEHKQKNVQEASMTDPKRKTK